VIELGAVELGVQATLTHEFIMPAALHDPAFVHDNDQIGITDG
jgi:hypothetical protein